VVGLGRSDDSGFGELIVGLLIFLAIGNGIREYFFSKANGYLYWFSFVCSLVALGYGFYSFAYVLPKSLRYVNSIFNAKNCVFTGLKAEST
jgi:hypothetical protein